MIRPGTSAEERLAALLELPEARAAGLWRIENGRLALVAFAPCAALSAEVARGFAEATRSVPLDQPGLGIVAAAQRGEPAVTRAIEMPEDSGSGLWLRRFGASRSIAVPLRDAGGAIIGVLSVALGSETLDEREVVESVREAGQGWS